MHHKLRMCLVLLAGLCLLAGCQKPQKENWADLAKLRSLNSVKAISDYFQKIESTTKIKTLDLGKSKWCFVTVYPYSGVGRMVIVCFSGFDTFWSLDTVLIVTRSSSPEVGFIPSDTSVDVVVDGSKFVTLYERR